MERLKAQGTIEFVILFGFALLFFTLILGAVQIEQSKKNSEKEIVILENIALDVQDEINLAAEASDGYSRNFLIPANILGKEYSITLKENFVVANISGNFASFRIFNTTGQINKGANSIRKSNGKVYLNQ